MSVNGITGNVAGSYVYTNNEQVATTSSAAEVSSTDSVSKMSTAASSGVIYEHDTDTEAATQANANKKVYKQDPQLISRLKADAEARTAQLENIVNQLISGQGKSFSIANGTNLKDFFENLTVDPATKAQAQKDIAEDGYYGVKQTSERIFDFAKALSGGDPDKMEEMRKAFEKGFKKATDAWGGDLPDISRKTYDAVQSLFDRYKNEQEEAAKTVAAAGAVDPLAQ